MNQVTAVFNLQRNFFPPFFFCGERIERLSIAHSAGGAGNTMECPVCHQVFADAATLQDQHLEGCLLVCCGFPTHLYLSTFFNIYYSSHSPFLLLINDVSSDTSTPRLWCLPKNVCTLTALDGTLITYTCVKQKMVFVHSLSPTIFNIIPMPVPSKPVLPLQ